MAVYTRTTTIDPAPGGDSVKSAILDLDTDLTGAFAGLNAIDAAKSSTSHNHDTIYASISNVVTNGNAHDHSGGDGATIDYNTLSGRPAGLLDETSHDALDHTGLTGIPAAYTLPTATTTTLGGVKIDGTSITIASGVISAATSGGVSDGDKGDITVSGSGATWTVDANVITPAKLSRTGTAGQVLTSGGAGADPSYTTLTTPTVPFASSAENTAGTIENKAVDPLGIREAFNATGGAPVFACRAWVTFNGKTTVAIGASGNVSSVTDNGAGDYTVNFTVAMPDINYCINSTTTQSDQATVTSIGIKAGTTTESMPDLLTTTSVRMLAQVASGTNVDSTVNCVSIFR